jgi:membrane-associated protease RseP (regulator of RpoE activity)
MLSIGLICYMDSSSTATLALVLVAWLVFYLAAKRLKLDERGWVLEPYYALYKSTKLNDLVKRIADFNPGFWRVLGNVGVAASVGQVSFITYILVKNLWSFFFAPEQASPVQPLIPGVTISVDSMPWFLLGAGIIILTHELGHGIMCYVEGVKVKSTAVMLAVITFGGAVEPDEASMEQASLMSKMRIFAIGSLVNLVTGLLTIPLFIAFGRSMPVQLIIFLNWVYFVGINLAMMNMLPIGPLDGGQMWRTYTERLEGGAKLQSLATYGFIALILSNISLSLAKFGFVPI